MRREVRKRWERANRCACCPCGRKKRSVPDVLLIWAASFEHWNWPLQGHLIAASLALDGLEIGDLP